MNSPERIDSATETDTTTAAPDAADQTLERADMIDEPTATSPTTAQPSPLERHPTDVAAFVFGILFLVVTALALLTQHGSLEDAAARSWAAGTVLIVAGSAAVIGTIVSVRRR